MFDVEDLIKATGGVLRPGEVPVRFGGVSIDSRTLRRGEIFVAVKGKMLDGHDFISGAVRRGAAAVVYADAGRVKAFKKGVAYLCVSETTRALGDLARYHRLRGGIPVIAVVGSSGKTTTKEMVAFVLSARYRVLKNVGTQNNLFGVPLTLLRIRRRHEICVVELGTNRFGEIGRLAEIASPNIGVLTNIGPSHLEFLKDLKGVYKEKRELLRHLEPPGIALLNRDDVFLGRHRRTAQRPYFFFGLNSQCDFRATEITHRNSSTEFLFNGRHRMTVKQLALHGVANALAAAACGLIFGLDMRVIRERIRDFEPLAMRLKAHYLKRCVVIDDTYNSNPLSLREAIDTLCRMPAAGRRILVMGDMLELGKKSEEFHACFGRTIAKKPVDLLVTLGRLTRETAACAARAGMGPGRVYHFEERAGVLKFLDDHIRCGDVVLIKGSRSMKMDTIASALRKDG